MLSVEFRVFYRCRWLRGSKLSVLHSTLSTLHSTLSIKVLCRECVALQQFGRSTLEDHFATFATSLRTDIYDVVGTKHHISVMLNNDNGIAQVAQLLE